MGYFDEFRADPPGGGYLADQIDQAGAEWRAGNKMKAAGIATRGALTSPLVAVGETLGRVAGDIGTAGKSLAPFASGLTGIDALAPQGQKPVVALSPPGARGLANDRERGDDYNWLLTANALPATGPLTTAAASTAQPPVPTDGVPDSIRNNAPFIAENQRLDAKLRRDAALQAADMRDADTRRMGASASIQAGLDADRAKWEARFEPTAGGRRRMLNRAADLADQSRAPLPGAQRNYLEEFARGENALSLGTEARSRAQLSEEAAKTGQLARAGVQLDVKQKQRLDALGTELAGSKDPKDISRIGSQIAAMLGKEKPGEWKAIHMAGGEVEIPGGMGAKMRLPDTLVLHNERTNEREIIGGAQATAPKMEEGKTYKDANGKPFRVVNGKPVPI